MKGKSTKQHKPGKGSWFFLVTVLLIYVVFALLNRELTSSALTMFNQLLSKVIPVLILVFLFIFIINLFMEPAWIKKYLGQHAGLTGWLVALVGGVLSTGPVYPWYALLRDLREKGMKSSLAAVFLYSRAIKLPLLPMLIHYFGMTYTLVLLGYLTVFAIASGLIMEKLLGINIRTHEP